LIHFSVQQKLTHCKSTTIIKKKKKRKKVFDSLLDLLRAIWVHFPSLRNVRELFEGAGSGVGGKRR